jgi:phospholipid/cholesterol/gamma-HCH transport system substrate-binding protein
MMDDSKAFEFKVGTFILIGIGLLFFIVFSIGDIYFAKPGYTIKVLFNFVGGIGPSAPVRFAGVGAGHVTGINLIYDEKTKTAKAEVTAWIEERVKIENDAIFVINTMGLLGERYLEIYPGTPGKPLLRNGDVLTGRDPVPMEKLTDNLAKLSDSISSIVGRIEKGEGTFGKLLMDDKLYNNIEQFTEKLNKGEGTLGQFLNNDSIYKNFEAMSDDLKRHPWKIFNKPRGE